MDWKGLVAFVRGCGLELGIGFGGGGGGLMSLLPPRELSVKCNFSCLPDEETLPVQ